MGPRVGTNICIALLSTLVNSSMWADVQKSLEEPIRVRRSLEVTVGVWRSLGPGKPRMSPENPGGARRSLSLQALSGARKSPEVAGGTLRCPVEPRGARKCPEIPG